MRQATVRSQTPLSLSQIQAAAPSVFADHPIGSVSNRYAFIPTSRVLDGLLKEGFQVYEAGQTITRSTGKTPFARHLLRLRRAGAKTLRQVGDEYPEVVLLNSHDGSSAYQLIGGIFRLVCSNGMVVGKNIDDISVRHSGNIVDDVIEGSFKVVESMDQIGQRVDEYSAITLAPREQLLLADAAATVRWGDNKLVTPEVLNTPRRPADNKPDLWTTFNRIQEHLTKGDDPGRAASGRRVKTRAVNSVSEGTNLNRALWQLADEFAKLKTGEK